MFLFHVNTMKTYLNHVTSGERPPATYWIGGWWASELVWTFWQRKDFLPLPWSEPWIVQAMASCSIYTQLLWMHSMLCFTWWPYRFSSEKAYWRNCKKNWLVLILPSLSDSLTIPSNTLALILHHLFWYALFTTVFMKIFLKYSKCFVLSLPSLLTPISGFISHVVYDSHWSVNLW